MSSLENILIGTKLLGSTFVQDPNPAWIKIDGVVTGNTASYGYSSGKNTDIGGLLNACALDPNIVVVLYNWSSGNYYTKSGFNLNRIPSDTKTEPVYTAFIYKARIQSSFLPTALITSVTPVVTPVVNPVPVVTPVVNPVTSTPTWSGNSVSYTTGQLVMYNGVEYKVLQSHVSEPQWTPSSTLSLFTPVATGTVPIVTPTVPVVPVVTPTVPTVPVVTPVTPVVTPVSNSSRVKTSYIDVLQWPTPDLVTVAQQAGLNCMSLAFITASSSNTPCWGQQDTYNMNGASSFMYSQIQAFKAIGGSVIISFGGASGQELANVISDPNLLAAQYQSVINTYNCNSLDFDVEGGNLTQSSSNVRTQALIIIQKNNPNIQISYTLPSTQNGLDSNGMIILNSAVQYGFKFDVLNLMAMDYGGVGFDMGQAAITACQGAYQQLQIAGLTSVTVGVCPMIGQQDVSGEVFTLANATTLINWCNSTPWISRVGFWSLGRDNGSGGVSTSANSAFSGIAQTPYEFSSIFNTFK